MAQAQEIKYNFSADGYIGTASPNAGFGPTRTGRNFDYQNDRFRLAALRGSLSVKDKSGFGLFLTAMVGDNADVLIQSDTSRGWFTKYLEEAYVSYDFKNGKTTADFGKFNSFIGYETVDTAQNPLYSQGLLNTVGQPANHTGLRINHELNDRVGVGLYALAGWNTTERSTQGVTLGGQVRMKLSEKTSAAVNVLTGREGSWHKQNNGGNWGGIGFAQRGVSEVTLADVIVKHRLNDKTEVGLNADYLTSKLAPNNGTMYGVALYGTYDLKPDLQLAARFETGSDPSGLRFGVPGTVQTLTIGANYKMDDRSTLRVELRHDRSNNRIFRSNNGLIKDQTTLNLGVNIKF